MPEQMMLENAWESDEAEDWESDESIAEADESAEDIGERARWRRRRSGPAYARGVPAYARGVSPDHAPVVRNRVTAVAQVARFT
jgi:hypothetical protein